MAHLTLHTAEILLPMGGTPPITEGGVVVDATGRVVAVGPVAELEPVWARRFDHPVIVPGFVNAHLHLTDAPLERTVGGGEGLPDWVGRLLAERSRYDAAAIVDSARRDLAAMRAGGTVAVGEVVNDATTLQALEGSGLRGRLIRELLGFRAAAADRLLADALADLARLDPRSELLPALAIHAPYSVSPRLMVLLVEEARRRNEPLFIHLAEDPEERHLFGERSGPWRELLMRLGLWDEEWRPEGGTPIEALARLGVIGPRLRPVHLTDATPAELRLLAEAGAIGILSPRSNLHITGRLPDMEALVPAGLLFALGSDGRGSSGGCDVVDEAALLAERFPRLDGGLLLEALTSGGGAALDIDGLGTIAPGARPGLVVIDCDPVPSIAAIERALLLERAPRQPLDETFPKVIPQHAELHPHGTP